jgi:hypothetical protein
MQGEDNIGSGQSGSSSRGPVKNSEQELCTWGNQLPGTGVPYIEE